MNSKSLKELYTKLSKDKKTTLILIIGIVGILLIMLSGTNEKDKSHMDRADDEMTIMSESELSERLEKLIESIDGAGKSRVMITFRSYCETVYAENTEKSIGIDGEKDTSDEYIIIDGSDGETGLKLKIISPEVKGVAVICRGGNNPVIKEQIISVVSALFDISSNKISVAVMAE